MLEKRSTWAFVLWAALASPACLMAGPPTPLTGQFTVNTSTEDEQNHPHAAAAGEDFLVVWTTHWAGHRGQRLDSQGRPLGDELLINARSHGIADVAGYPSGELVAAYALASSRLELQRFDVDGTPLGAPVPVATIDSIGSDLADPRLAIDDLGQLMVVWHTATWSTGPQRDRVPFPLFWTAASGRGFAADGTAIGEAFTLAIAKGEEGAWPLVVADGSGTFTISWDELAFAGRGARSFALDGTPLGAPHPLPSWGAYQDEMVAMARLAGGALALVWIQEIPDSTAYLQLIDPAGVPLGEPRPLGTGAIRAEITATPDGGFAVVWSGGQVYLQWFDAAARPSGPAVRVDEQHTVWEGLDVAATADGHILVTWASVTPETEGDIQGRVFRSPSLFADGFESGDTGAWSVTVP